MSNGPPLPSPTPPAGPRSASSPTPLASPPGGFPLAGPSQRPDPATHAYRRDLADVALAGHVIASHYAELLRRSVSTATPLRSAPDEAANTLADLQPGTILDMLDNSRGWAWGYAGEERLVGYVPSEALA